MPRCTQWNVLTTSHKLTNDNKRNVFVLYELNNKITSPTKAVRRYSLVVLMIIVAYYESGFIFHFGNTKNINLNLRQGTKIKF